MTLVCSVRGARRLSFSSCLAQHFVAGLDEEPEMRPILVLQENVATGAADAYARMTGVPASTLLHLAPGMGNGYANLHNARKNRCENQKHNTT